MTDSASQSLVAELEMLLAAVHADDPKREILVRVGDALREAETAAARITELEAERDRLAGELDTSNNNHRAMAHQLAELGARCKHAESELSRVEEDTRERCAAVALDNRQHSNQLSYRDDSNGYAEMAYEQACDDIVECIRSHPL
ncbi:MAG: hypothetical protein NVV83_10575 [Afipia sp.]|nr:hypothetical protein [Afipia sp.]